MASTDPSRKTRNSNVFITFNESTNAYRVHAPGNVEGVDIAHAHGSDRSVYWVFHNQTNQDVTVKLKFDANDFRGAFQSTNPPAQDDGASKTITQRVPKNAPATVEGVTKKPSMGGRDVTFELFVEDSKVDPGLRIDDGNSLTYLAVLVAFALGAVAGLVAGVYLSAG